jgi:hypothetical protein
VTAKIGSTSITTTFKIIEPTEIKYIRKPYTYTRHVYGVPSVGFRAYMYIAPDTVSFSKIRVEEGIDLATGTGYLLYANLEPHYEGRLLSALKEWKAGFGTRVNGVDTVEIITENEKPYANGTFEWRIPQLFQVGIGQLKQFSTSVHYATTDNTGKATLSKIGVTGPALSASANLTDPNQGYGD